MQPNRTIAMRCNWVIVLFGIVVSGTPAAAGGPLGIRQKARLSSSAAIVEVDLRTHRISLRRWLWTALANPKLTAKNTWRCLYRAAALGKQLRLHRRRLAARRTSAANRTWNRTIVRMLERLLVDGRYRAVVLFRGRAGQQELICDRQFAVGYDWLHFEAHPNHPAWRRKLLKALSNH